jgi:hypothetical protein
MKSFLFAIFFTVTAVLSVNAGSCPSGGCGGGKDKSGDKAKDPTKSSLILVP